MNVALVAALALVNTAVEPQSAFLGDPIELDALVSARDPASVRVDARLGPLRELERVTERDGELVRVRIRAACTSAACLDRVVALPKLRVTADGRTVERAWSSIRFGARTPRRISGEPPWRLDDLRPPPVTYRVRPRAAEVFLVALAVLLAAAGAVLLVGAIRSRRPERALTPLERALRAARDALRGDEGARRLALGALSRVALDPLASRARAAAWANEPPSREQVETLARAAEQEAKR